MTKHKTQAMQIRQAFFITFSLLLIVFFLMGCQESTNLDKPPEILFGQDVCDECSMIINEERFAASYITRSGEVRRFDDIGGMLMHDYKHQEDVHRYWVHDLDTREWLTVNQAHFVVNDELVTPMGWGVAAFATQEQAEAYVAENGGVIADFAVLQQEIADGTLDPATLSSHQHEGNMEMEGEIDHEAERSGE